MTICPHYTVLSIDHKNNFPSTQSRQDKTERKNFSATIVTNHDIPKRIVGIYMVSLQTGNRRI